MNEDLAELPLSFCWRMLFVSYTFT